MKKILLSCILICTLVACSEDNPVPALNVSMPQAEFEASGGSVDIKVTCNNDWSVTLAANEWCSVSPTSGKGNGSFKITVQPNQKMEELKTTISVKSGMLEKVITVILEATSVEAFLTGNWVIKAQNSGDNNYNDFIGAKIEFKDNKKVFVDLGIDVPGMGVVESFEGDWSLTGQTLSIAGTLMQMPVELKLAITQLSGKIMNATLSANLPLLPPAGIPIILEKSSI